MARDFGVVQQDSTLNVFFTTAIGTGARTAFANVLEDADIVLVKDGTVATITTTLTHTLTFNSDAGIYKLAIDLSGDADFTAGSDWTVYGHPDTEQLDSVDVAFIICTFTIESNAQAALRAYQTAVYLAHLVVNAAGNDTTTVDLQDFLDAQAPNNANNGDVWLWQDSTGELEKFRVQSSASLVATVEKWPGGGAMSAAVAIGDSLWPLTHVDVNVDAVGDTQQTAGDLAALITTVDTVVDAIKVITDALTSAGAASLALSAAGIVNGAAATGTLSTTQCTSDLTGYVTGELVGRTITFTGGTAAGQQARITAYTSTNGDVEFTTITTAPANLDTFVIT